MKFSHVRIASGVVVAAAAVALFGCKLTKPVPANIEKYNLNRPPVEAPASVKAIPNQEWFRSFELMRPNAQ